MGRNKQVGGDFGAEGGAPDASPKGVAAVVAVARTPDPPELRLLAVAADVGLIFDAHWGGRAEGIASDGGHSVGRCETVGLNVPVPANGSPASVRASRPTPALTSP